MTQKQIAFASRHDWFAGSENGAVAVREHLRAADGRWTTTIRTISDFRDLMQWAGY